MTAAGEDPWRDKVAVISGASSGIGAAVARALAAEGLRVALGARRTDRMAELAASLPPGRAWSNALDVTDPAAVDAFYAALDAHWGPSVHVLVNSAGVGFRGTLDAQPPHEWEAMLAVNVMGLLRMTQPALTRMRTAGQGHVFNVSSMSGYRVGPRSAVYSATKHAVRGLTEGLRQDLREANSPIRVTAVSPGFVDTEILEPYLGGPEAARKAREAYPLLRPEDVASAVVYALRAPAHMQVHDVLMRPTAQPF